jgi:hypothetical protein
MNLQQPKKWAKVWAGARESVKARVKDKERARAGVKARAAEKATEVADGAIDSPTNNQSRRYIMPGFNQQGPRNQGPMTGRGMGMCAKSPMADSPNFSNPAGRGLGLGFRRGRGFSQGRGRGMGPCWGQGYGQAATAAGEPGTMPANTMEDLKLRAERLESELNAIRQGISALSGSSDTQ